ncbi:PREDICTED: uncharacterized serine-rich protein C215.13-like, partial [Amphimedon queenslandica]|uniref:Uncharacterized protein n=1 Tax=Amphimedon queenslandica TaxID=400682 RepID=A0AAN0K4T3_AMPQE
MCDLSLCDAKVMRGVRPLIGWIFRNLTHNSVLSNLENTIQALRMNLPEYCNETEVSSCVLPSVEPTMSSTLISSSIYRSPVLISSSPFSPSKSTLPSSSPTATLSSPAVVPSSLATPSSLSSSSLATPSSSSSSSLATPSSAPTSSLATPSSSLATPPLAAPSSSPTQGEDDGSVLIIQVSIALGSIVPQIIILVIIIYIYCLYYRNKASINLVTPHSID